MDTVVQTSGELVLVFGSYWKSFSAFGVLWSGIDIYCKWLITSRLLAVNLWLCLLRIASALSSLFYDAVLTPYRIRRVRSVSCGLLAFAVGFG